DDSVLKPVLVVQQQMSAIRVDSVQDQFTHAISSFIASQWHRVTFGAASRADLRASREITGRSGPRRPEMWTRSRGMFEARGREPSAARGSEPGVGMYHCADIGARSSTVCKIRSVNKTAPIYAMIRMSFG